MIKNVVVPIDGSTNADRALLPAVEVARLNDASIILVMAVHQYDEELAFDQLRDRALQTRYDKVQLVVDIENGPVAAISKVVEANDDVLVCMTTHGRTGFVRALLGSVAEETLREVSAPFLLVGPKTDLLRGIDGPVTIALDGSERSSSIIPLAKRWAQSQQVGVWLVSVADPAAGRGSDFGGDLDESAFLERVARPLADEVVSVDWDTLRNPDPAAAIAEFAKEKGTPIIALATHGRSGLARVALGSIAARIVHQHEGLTLVLRCNDLVD